METGINFRRIGIVLVVIVFALLVLLSFMADQGLLDRWLVEKVGTDTVGLVREYDGRSYMCKHVGYNGYCDEWDAIQDTALDVANNFGPNMLGVAKGEVPLLDSNLWYAPILNPLNSMVFSLSMDSGLPIFFLILVAVLISGTVIVVLVKPNSAGVVFALYSLPAYVAFLSMSSLIGGQAGVMGIHGCIVPLVILVSILKAISKINLVFSSSMDAEGNSTTQTLIGKAAEGFGKPKPIGGFKIGRK